MTVMMQIARYRPFTNRNNGGSVDVVAVDRNENLPADLHILSAPLSGTNFRFAGRAGTIADVNLAVSGTETSTVVFHDGRASTTISLHPIDDVFSNSDFSKKLAKMNGGLETGEELIAICQKAITRLVGRAYPEAALRIEDGDIIVDSPTAIPVRIRTGAKPSAMLSGGPRNSRLHVWI